MPPHTHLCTCCSAGPYTAGSGIAPCAPQGSCAACNFVHSQHTCGVFLLQKRKKYRKMCFFVHENRTKVDHKLCIKMDDMRAPNRGLQLPSHPLVVGCSIGSAIRLRGKLKRFSSSTFFPNGDCVVCAHVCSFSDHIFLYLMP